MNKFPERLNTLRTNKKMSQKDLAVILKVTNSSISDWECGRAEPNIEMLIQLAEFFGETVDYLVGSQNI